MSLRRLFLIALALGSLLVGCSDEKSDGNADPADESASTDGAGSNDGGADDASTTSEATGDGASDCRAWIDGWYSVQGIIGEEAAADAIEVISELDASVPDDVKGEWAVLSPLYLAIAESIVENGQLADETNAAVAAVNEAAPQEAITEITAWSATCV